MTPPRVVLDTNCLVSALIFGRGPSVWLRQAWQAQRCIPLASRQTVSELLRVLAYPKFKLDRQAQETLLAEYLPYTEVVPVAALPPDLPPIRDPQDQMFLALAQTGQAEVLVSVDADLLALKGVFAIPILTLAEFSVWLDRSR